MNIVDIGSFYTQSSAKTVSNTVAETSLLNSTYTFPAGFFTQGKSIHIKLYGIHSAVTTPTINIRVKLGTTTIVGTGVVNSGNSTNASVILDVVLTCYTTGVSGTLSGQGIYNEAGGGTNIFPMVNTGTITIDTTTTQVFDITAQWGTASSSNSISITDGYIEILN